MEHRSHTGKVTLGLSQRVIPLRFRRTHGRKGIDVQAPPNPNVALPGYYMLFTFSADGVPSVATWVRVRGDAPDAPSLAGFK